MEYHDAEHWHLGSARIVPDGIRDDQPKNNWPGFIETSQSDFQGGSGLSLVIAGPYGHVQHEPPLYRRVGNGVSMNADIKAIISSSGPRFLLSALGGPQGTTHS